MSFENLNKKYTLLNGCVTILLTLLPILVVIWLAWNGHTWETTTIKTKIIFIIVVLIYGVLANWFISKLESPRK